MIAPFLPGLRSVLAPMGPRSRPAAARSLRQATLPQIEARLAAGLNGRLFLEKEGPAFSRERIYGLRRTFWCWIWQILQGHAPCREVVRQVQALFGLLGAGAVDEGTAAYCQARGKIALPWLEKVSASVVAACRARAPRATLLQGRALRAIDGSGTRMSDTPLNRQEYPPSNQLAGTGFPYLRFTALFCLQTGGILAHATGSLRQAEQPHLLGFRAALQKRDVLVADRAYGCFGFLALLPTWGVDFIARLPEHNRPVDFAQPHRSLGPEDALFVWKKPKDPSRLMPKEDWKAMPSEITVRVIRHTIERKGFRTRQLAVVTTLLDEQIYPAAEILEAYLLRWRMEMCLDDIKTNLGMERLASRSPLMARKELQMFFIAHNLVRWLMLQSAAAEEGALAQISFKGTLDAFRQWSQAMAQLGSKASAERKRQIWQRLLQTMRADAVPKRPGRREPRAVKHRPKYDWLNKPRSSYIESPRRNERRRRARARRAN